MLKFKSPFAVVLFLVITFFSCAKENDLPELIVTSPVDGAVIYVNSSIIVDAMLAESLIMDQYKVQLKLSTPSEPIDSTQNLTFFGDSAYLYVSNLNYNQNAFQHIINIPGDFTPGSYLLIISALNGQYAEGKDTLDIYIRNLTDTIKPAVTISLPGEGTSYNKLDTMNVFAVIQDELTDLSSGFIYRLKVTVDPDFSGQAPVDIYNQNYPLSDTLDLQYIIPNSFNSGLYKVRFTAVDEFNNATISEIGISVN